MEAIPKVCRTASTLYELMAYYKALSLINKPDSSQAGMGKWGNSLRTAIARWYLNRAPIDVAMQVMLSRVLSRALGGHMHPPCRTMHDHHLESCIRTNKFRTILHKLLLRGRLLYLQKPLYRVLLLCTSCVFPASTSLIRMFNAHCLL